MRLRGLRGWLAHLLRSCEFEVVREVPFLTAYPSEAPVVDGVRRESVLYIRCPRCGKRETHVLRSRRARWSTDGVREWDGRRVWLPMEMSSWIYPPPRVRGRDRCGRPES